MSDKITLQKIFDLAWQEFIIEGKPPSYGVGPGGIKNCQYRDSNGNKCAVGLALPDDIEYCGDFHDLVEFTISEGRDIFDSSITEAVHTPQCRLNEFQHRLHDKWVRATGEFEGQWGKSLQERMDEYLKVAEEYGLTIPPARPTQPTDH